MGCGRVFEGTYEQMFDSLNKIKVFLKIQKFIVVMNILKKILNFVLNTIQIMIY